MNKILDEFNDNILGLIFVGLGIVLLFLGEHFTVIGLTITAFGIGIIVGRHSG